MYFRFRNEDQQQLARGGGEGEESNAANRRRRARHGPVARPLSPDKVCDRQREERARPAGSGGGTAEKRPRDGGPSAAQTGGGGGTHAESVVLVASGSRNSAMLFSVWHQYLSASARAQATALGRTPRGAAGAYRRQAGAEQDAHRDLHPLRAGLAAHRALLLGRGLPREEGAEQQRGTCGHSRRA